MAFDLPREIFYFNLDGSEVCIRGYVREPHGIFAICRKEPDKVDSRTGWVLVHRTSQTILVGVLRTKREAERFFEYLSNEYDLNSLFLVNPHGEPVKEELNDFISTAYSKFYKEVRRPFG